MAETNDRNAHGRSIRPMWNSITMLNGRRYGGRYSFEANQTYAIPRSRWEAACEGSGDMASDKMVELIQWYVNDHYNYQLPRILELERYYAGDENIHYWDSGKGPNQSDEKINSGYPQYITDIHTGYELANPLTYGYDNPESDQDDGQDFLDQLKVFNRINDEPYHEMTLFKNACNTGRAYELIYCPKDSNVPEMAAVDPNQAFVVWSTDVKPVELFAVRYFAVNVQDVTTYQIEVYTEGHVYYFDAKGDPSYDWTQTYSNSHLFGHVQLLEYRLNEERMGIWEGQIDNIDAYDIAKSEMANSQEDFSNAKLVVSGVFQRGNHKDPMTDSNGDYLFIDNVTGKVTYDFKDRNGKQNKQAMKPTVNTMANTIFLKPYVFKDANGNKQFNQTTAQYLTKETNATDWKTYIDEIKQRIIQGTNTPDMSDESFSGNSSGEELSYKLWGTDQHQAQLQNAFKSSIMRRLRLLAIQWDNAKAGSVNAEDYRNVTVSFTPNMPKDDAKQVELITKALAAGAMSVKTAHDRMADITGVPSDTEDERQNTEDEKNAGNTHGTFQQALSDAKKNLGDGGNDGHDPATGTAE